MDKQERGNEVFGAPSPSVHSVSKDDNPGPAAVEPKSIDYKTADGGYGQYIWRYISSSAKHIIIAIVIAVLLSIPVIIDRDYQDPQQPIDPESERRQLRYFIFAWLLTSWLCLYASFAIGTALPYIFRLIARYVNPAHVRYWRVFRVLRRPITLVGFLTSAFVSFVVFLVTNDILPMNQTQDAEDVSAWIDVVTDILGTGALWTGIYILEKVLILYITIHYHFRSDMGRIAHSKDMQNALMALYEASVYLYPVGSPEFEEEDGLIGNATGAEHGEYRLHASRYLARLGIDTYALTSFFGNFLQSDPKRHWLRPASNYAIVERAMANPKSAAALGRRIWMSFVVVGKDKLTSQDIAEVLGPFRKEESESYFKVLDENEARDIQLDEMEWIVVLP